MLWEFTAIQQTFISCVLRASKGQPGVELGFCQGLAFLTFPRSPSHCRVSTQGPSGPGAPTLASTLPWLTSPGPDPAALHPCRRGRLAHVHTRSCWPTCCRPAGVSPGRCGVLSFLWGTGDPGNRGQFQWLSQLPVQVSHRPPQPLTMHLIH